MDFWCPECRFEDEYIKEVKPGTAVIRVKCTDCGEKLILLLGWTVQVEGVTTEVQRRKPNG